MFSRIRNQTLQWWHDVPLPAGETDVTPSFHPWHLFDSSVDKWVSFDSTSNSGTGYKSSDSGKFVLCTWNVDATSPAPETRISALISHIQSLTTPVDIIFLQEVSRSALWALLEMPWLREHWYSSEADTTNWGKQAFANMTFVSRTRLTGPEHAALSPIWRVKYPSRFERDALCCDILLPSQGGAAEGPLRLRLANVHLDSLPINPSLRPRQLSIITSYLNVTGHGLIAGDFNPVLPGDDAFIGVNGLLDVWCELYPGESGFTWGVDGDEPFPPNRLDKVAVAGLKPCSIDIIVPGFIEQAGTSELKQGEVQKHHDSSLKWSDHSGLVCSFAVD